MGLVERLFDVRCPACDKAMRVPETILVDIVRHLQESSMDAGQLRLVCPACKDAFHFDFHRRSEKTVCTTALPLHPTVAHTWFAISAQCGESNYCPPTALFAIRKNGTTGQEIERE